MCRTRVRIDERGAGVGGLAIGKKFRHGTHRTATPAETVDRVRPLLASMGITRLANVTGLDVLGIPVVMACRPNSRGLAVAQGKGLTVDAAKASAAMESIESYHAENVVLPMLLRSHDELHRSDGVPDLDRLAATTGVTVDPDRRMLWVSGRDLLTEARIWVPFDLVHLDFTAEQRVMAPAFPVTSTGLASGNHHLEAVSHALTELIERDAAARWHDADPPARDATRLDLDTVDDPDGRRLVEAVIAAGMRLTVHDLTSHFGVSVFRCEIVEDPRRGPQAICSAGGYGCHPDRDIALSRAITEAAQSRLTLIAGSRDDTFRPEYQAARDHDALTARWDQADGGGMRPFLDVPTSVNETFDDDLTMLLHRLREGGAVQVVVVDLTQERFGLPVVRAVVPGLRQRPHDRPANP